MAHRPRRLVAAGLVLAGALTSAACDPLAVSTTGDAVPAHAAADPAGQAETSQLKALPVQAHSSLAGYSRAEFGPTWSDEGTVELAQNHCPTCDDTLFSDLSDAVREQDGCTVVSGVLHDRYTGKSISFHRGRSTSLVVQIDHIVALGLSWQSGARNLTASQRLNLANDPENLIATDGPTNAAKGAKDASQWLPPRNDARCWYASAQVRVNAKYRLSVSRAEKQALGQALESCPASGTDAKGAR